MNSKTQVVIIGAGPTGLSMAVQLLRYKIDFIILEKNQKTTPFSKAVVVQARTLEIFQELGLAKKAINQGQIATGLNLFNKGKQKAKVNLSGLGKGLSPFPFALSLEQSKTEKLLVDYLLENQKEILWQSEFSHFTQNEDGVTVFYTDRLGKEQKIEAEYLVGCDGASSEIRHQMGLSFEGDTAPKIFYVADVKLKSTVINTDELFMFMIEKGFILFFPMEGKGHFRVVGILSEAEDVAENFKFSDIENEVIQKVLVPLQFEEIVWFSHYKVHTRKADSFEKGRCYLAGDAAHIHTPAGGQGMNTGIQDAYNLAWKIAFVIRGQVSSEVLKTYSIERIENAKHLLKSTDRLFDLMSGKNAFWNFVRLHIFTKIIGLVSKSATINKWFFPLISQTGISYSENYLIIKSSVGKAKAGIRMPFFTFFDGKSIFEYIANPTFKVLSFGNKNAATIPIFNNLKIKIETHVFSEIPTSIFGTEKDFYILLRPDNHISFIGKDLNKCKEMLQKISLHTE